jgi:hypothetical protein
VRPDVEDLVPEVNEDETVETDKIDEDDGRVRRLRGKAAEG